MASGKVSSRARNMANAASDRDESLPVIVKFHSEHSQVEWHQQSAPLTAQSRRKEYSLIPAIALSVHPTEIDELAEMEEVAEVWYDEPVHILLDSSTASIHVPPVWTELSIEGEGVTVCVLDTGIDVAHPDLAERLWLSADFTGTGSVADGYGHGTHIASIVAGSGQASAGRYRGVAPKARLMAAKVLDDQGNGRMSDVMEGIEWAVDNTADILVLSLGTEGSSDGNDALSTMANAVVEKGRIVVVAAGNGGPASYSIGSPGAADRAITVGATIDDGAIADYSGRGPTADGRTKPEVVAPGSNVTAARSHGIVFGSPVDEFYTSVTGSSMAVPHVAGLCALIWSANRALLPDDVKWLLMDTAVDLGKPVNAQGAGRVDAFAAVQAALAARASASTATTAAPSTTPAPAADTGVASAGGTTPTGSAPKGTPGCLGALISLMGFRW